MKPIQATFCGIQEGFGSIGPIELWTICESLAHYPAGSTLSLKTLHTYNRMPATLTLP